MAVVMTAEEFARRYGADLPSLEDTIDEARKDAITKDSMNRDSLVSHNITAGTERFMRDYLRRASSGDE